MRSCSNFSSRQWKTDCSKKEKQGCHHSGGNKIMTLYVIGTGPGKTDYMSQRAIEVIKKVDCVAGYTTYIDLIKTVIKDKQIIATGMKKEVERVEKAIAEALTASQQEIDLLKQLADKYKTQKRGLMKKILTGEWRVKPEIVNQYMEA